MTTFYSRVLLITFQLYIFSILFTLYFNCLDSFDFEAAGSSLSLFSESSDWRSLERVVRRLSRYVLFGPIGKRLRERRAAPRPAGVLRSLVVDAQPNRTAPLLPNARDALRGPPVAPLYSRCSLRIGFSFAIKSPIFCILNVQNIKYSVHLINIST